MPHYLKSTEEVGKRFGRLLVVGVGSPGPGRARRLVCRCDCGTEREMHARGVRDGVSLSCGCLRLERVRAAVTTHGLSRNITYKSYKAMVGRCYDVSNASYRSYGARGVTVCEKWRQDYANFLTDLGERPSKRHSIDRIDNSKGYEPGNCRWATGIEQQANRSITVKITAFGITLTRAEWSRRSGLPAQTIRQRLLSGWTPDRAVSTPGRKHGIEVRIT